MNDTGNGTGRVALWQSGIRTSAQPEFASHAKINLLSRLISMRVLPRFIRLFLAVLGVSLLISLAPARALLAGDLPPGQDSLQTSYTVLPGDTLAGIAVRSGVNLHTLLQQNGIPSPANIYPGQVILIPLAWAAALDLPDRSPLGYGATLLDVSRSTGITWEQLATANRILQPAALVPGYMLSVPGSSGNVCNPVPLPLTPVAAALTCHLPLWTVLRLNPYPMLSTEPVIVPANRFDTHDLSLPSPLYRVTVSPQPVIRGTSLEIVVQSGLPLTCSLSFLEREVPCYADNESNTSTWRYTALLGISPQLDPGAYTATLNLQAEADPAFSLPIPVRVSAGRYDYERIDLPPDRESLLDPALSQLESRKIADLRTLRTPDRLWTLPFSLPLQGSVTSYFGSRRSYGYGFGSFHGGTDFRARIGTPVTAPDAGVVVLAEPLVVRGNAVIIDHGWGVMTGYWHLSRIDVVVGQTVNRGDQLGAVGNTGLSTGPHLHWELWVNGVSVSPLAWANVKANIGEHAEQGWGTR